VHYTLRKTDDIDEVYDLHTLAFPADHWPGDTHEFWIAKNPIGKPVGFCSAFYFSKPNGIYLSRAAITLEARGEGLQRRMIQARLNWGRRETAAQGAWTFVKKDNYESLINLLKCGFRIGKPHRLAKQYFQFYKPFYNNPDWDYGQVADCVF
jgi:GNAT superfamily N-acetyltransferase